MYANKLFALLVAALPAMVDASYVSPIVSQPASDAAVQSKLDAYVSALTTDAAFKSLSSGLPFNILDNLQAIGFEEAALTSDFPSLATALQAFITSVANVEQSIQQTTLAPSVLSSFISAERAQFTSVQGFLTKLLAEPGVSSIVSQLPVGLQDFLEVVNDFEPLYKEYGSALPEDVKSLISKIASYENNVYSYTAIGFVETGVTVALPSTTFTGGTFLATPTTGASAGSGPAATGASSSSSTAAAATGLGCGSSCRVMAGAMAGVALGAIAL